MPRHAMLVLASEHSDAMQFGRYTARSDTTPDLSYAERLVGFIDILGLQIWSSAPDRSQGLRNQIVEALCEVQLATAPVPLAARAT